MSGQTRTVGPVSAVPTIVVLLALGLALRLIIAYALLPHSGFPSDLGTFQAWGNEIGRSGPMGFYDTAGFHDYPPVYLYMLGFLGFFTQPGMGMLVKLPPMLFDLALAVVVWKMAEEFGASRRLAVLAAVVIVVNPVTWFNSAVWGQADSVGTVILLLGLRELIKDHREAAAALAVTAVLTKPQLGILAILVGFVVIRRSLWPKSGPAEPRRIVTTALAGAYVGAAICFPIVGLHLDALQTEWASPAGKLEALGAVLVALATLYIVLTSRNEWLTGGAHERADLEARSGFRPIDRWHAATAIFLPLFGAIVFAGIRFDVIVGQMINTFGEYSWLTVNAYNPWALVSDNGEGMAFTHAWIHDGPWADANGSGGGFAVGPFPTAVVAALAILAAGLVVALAARAIAMPRWRRTLPAVAAVTVVLAAIAAAVFALGPLPKDVSVPASFVGEFALLCIFALTCCWAAWHDDHAALLVALAVLAIAFFVVPTRAHERYLFPFFGVGAVLLAVSWRWAALYAVFVVANLANLLAVLVQYGGIVPQEIAANPLEQLLRDWGSWILDSHVNATDTRSLIFPVAAVSVVMGLGFLWVLAQLRPGAALRLEGERVAAGREPALEYHDGSGEQPKEPRRELPRPHPRPIDRRTPEHGVLRKTGTRTRAVSESNRDA